MNTHEEFKTDEVAERYVRGQLGDEERQAFEEHFLNCDACFDNVRQVQRFVSGVRHASEAGLLDAPTPAPLPVWQMVPALAYVVLTVLIVASGVWIWSLRTSMDVLARQKQALAEELTSARSALTMAQKAPEPYAGQLPLAILDASRTATGENEISIPGGQFALWIQLDAEPKPNPLEVQISDSQHHVIVTLSGVHENRYGAVAITLPSAKFPAGTYWVRVFREGGVLAREYSLKLSAK